jgi:hypothetical protein
MVWRKFYMEKCDGLRAQKRYESKPFLMAPQSHVYVASYPRAERGYSLSINSCSISEERQLMKIEMMVETSAHSINGRHRRLDHGD